MYQVRCVRSNSILQLLFQSQIQITVNKDFFSLHFLLNFIRVVMLLFIGMKLNRLLTYLLSIINLLRYVACSFSIRIALS